MRSLLLLATLSLLPTSYLRGQPEQAAPGPDLVIIGPVLTLDESRPRASGLVIDAGRILKITDAASAYAAAGPGTRIVEVPASGVAMPGIIDSHAHLRGVGTAMRQLDLRRVARAERICYPMDESPWSLQMLGRGAGCCTGA